MPPRSLPSLQVVIPVRNGGEPMAATLRSLAASEDRAFTVLISDNHSTDGAPWKEALSLFASDQVRIIQPPEPLGRVEHWSWALQQADADYCKLLTSGDRLPPEHLRVVRQTAAELEPDLIFTPFAVLEPGTNLENLIRELNLRDGTTTIRWPEFVSRCAREDNFIGPGSGVTFHTSSLHQALPYDAAYPWTADWRLYAKILRTGTAVRCESTYCIQDRTIARFSSKFRPALDGLFEAQACRREITGQSPASKWQSWREAVRPAAALIVRHALPPALSRPLRAAGRRLTTPPRSVTTLKKRISDWFESRPGRSSTILSWTNQAVSISVNLAIVPLVFYRVTTETAWFWFTLLYWAGLFSILDFGLSQSITRQVAFSHGKKGFFPGRARGRFLRVGGPRTTERVLSAARFIFHLISLIILVFGIVAERTFLFSGHMEAGYDAHICWYLLVFATILGNENRVYGIGVSGALRIPQIRALGLFQTFFQNGLIAVVLFIWPRLELLGVALIINNLMWRRGLLKLWNEAKPPGFKMGRPKWTIVRVLWKASWEQGLASASAYFTFSINPILIGHLLGPAALTTYSFPLRISTLLFVSLTEIISPQVNFMIALYRDNNIHSLLIRFFRVFIVISGASFVGFLGFAIFGPWVVHVWSLGKVSPPVSLFWVMALFQFLAILQTMLALFITVHGLQPFVKAAVACATLNVCFLFALTPYLGLTGAGMATFLSQLLTSNWFMPWFAARLFRDHFKQVPFATAWHDTWVSLKHELHLLRHFVGRRRT